MDKHMGIFAAEFFAGLVTGFLLGLGLHLLATQIASGLATGCIIDVSPIFMLGGGAFGIAIGNSAVGKIFKQTGSFWFAVAGSILGGLCIYVILESGVAFFPELDKAGLIRSSTVIITYIILPHLFATIGYNLKQPKDEEIF